MKIGKAPFGDRYCLLTVPNLDTNKMEILNTLPSYKRWIGRDLLFQPTSASLGRLHKFFPDIKWDEDVQHHLDNYIKLVNIELIVVNIKYRLGIPKIILNFNALKGSSEITRK